MIYLEVGSRSGRYRLALVNTALREKKATWIAKELGTVQMPYLTCGNSK
jgi:hypothetical protein